MVVLLVYLEFLGKANFLREGSLLVVAASFPLVLKEDVLQKNNVFKPLIGLLKMAKFKRVMLMFRVIKKL